MKCSGTLPIRYSLGHENMVVLKCYYDQIIDIHFFTFSSVQYDFLTYLAKFQSITNIRSHSFFTFISENLRPPLPAEYLTLFQGLVAN